MRFAPFSSCLLTMFTASILPAAPTTEAPVGAPEKIVFEEYDLPNGLHVILHQDRSVPVISTYVLYHVGSKNERADRTGFAHFFEHLMFEGTKNIPRSQIDKLISGAGGNLNASTSFDQTDYYFNLPSNQLKLGLWIESERMLQAQIDETGVETQRKVVKEERSQGVDNRPFGTLFENLAALVFEGSPYEWTPIGSVQYIDEAKIDEFRDFYKQYYVPNNAILAVAGDFDIAETKKWIEEYFGSIPRGAEIKRPQFDLSLQKEAKTKSVEHPTTPLPATLHAWRGPKLTEKDAYALDLLSNILASGRSSRLYRKLVDQEQAAVEIEAFPFFLENGGMIGVFGIGRPGMELAKLDALIDAEIEHVRKNGVTESEFQKAQNQKERELASSYGSMNSRAKNLARYHLYYGDTNLVNTEIDTYRSITREDLQRVAEKYFAPSGRNLLHYPAPGASKKAAPAPSQN